MFPIMSNKLRILNALINNMTSIKANGPRKERGIPNRGNRLMFTILFVEIISKFFNVMNMIIGQKLIVKHIENIVSVNIIIS